MLAEAAEGRRPSAAEAHLPTVHMSNTPTVSGTYGNHGQPAPDPAAATVNHPTSTPNYPTSHAPNHQTHHPTHHATPHQPPSGPAPRTRGRRRGRTLALVVVIAALVGGGGAAAMRYADEWGSSGASSSPSSPAKSSSPAGDEAPSGGVPDSWVRVDDPKGFSLALPSKAWKRQVMDDFQVDYTPDGGKHFVRIAVDDSPDFPTPFEHLLDLEQQLQRLRDYRRVSLEENVFRDRPSARWDFTWTAVAKDTAFPGPRRAIEETYLSRDGIEYAIYMSAPAADWEKTRRQFDHVLQGWRPSADTAG
jgi:hypothetical protein